jgi:hypothetical protein
LDVVRLTAGFDVVKDPVNVPVTGGRGFNTALPVSKGLARANQSSDKKTDANTVGLII